MESQMFDIVKLEKEKAIARFNCFRRIAKSLQILEVLVVLGLISWSSVRVPAVFKAVVGCFVAISAALFNHHVVFLIGNAIIVLLYLLCRQNDAVCLSSGDLYSDYMKHSEAAAAADHHRGTAAISPPSPAPDAASEEGECGGDEEKQIVIFTEETAQCADMAEAIAVAAAIEKATRQLKRFQRTQSEKLRREIRTMPAKLGRLEILSRRNSVSSGERLERLSSEEFQRTVDAFIDQHWCKKETKHSMSNE